MKTSTFQFFQNTLGMNLRFNDVSLDAREAEEITNLHATTEGSWTSRNTGYIQLNETAVESGASITSLYEYVTLSGLKHIIASAGEKMLTLETGSGTFTEIGDSLTDGETFCFVTFNGLLIGCNGSDTPQKWDGTGNIGNLDGWPPVISGVTPSNPSLCATYINRVVFSGDSNNPSMLYISEQENPENFTPGTGATAAGSIQVSPGDGQKITALKSMYLPLENEEVLVIFKERSTYLMTGSDADTFAIQKLSDEFGAASQQSVVLVGNELFFLTYEGITALSTATLQGNITSSFISDKIRPQINTLNKTKLSESFAIHLRDRQEVWWVVAHGSSSENNLVLVFNYGMNRAWSRRTGIEAACGLVADGRLYTGTYNGFVQEQMKGHTYNGSAIPWLYKTPFYDLGTPRIRKRVKDIEVFLRQVAQIDITVKTAWDIRRGGQDRQETTLSVVPDTSSSVYGTGIFGSDYYDVTGISILKFIPPGSGKFFQMELSGNTPGKPVEIQGWSVTTMYGGFR